MKSATALQNYFKKMLSDTELFTMIKMKFVLHIKMGFEKTEQEFFFFLLRLKCVSFSIHYTIQYNAIIV